MQNLNNLLIRIDGKSYKAYKEIQGKYIGKDFTLYIDYVQGDPFASPSRIRISFPKSFTQHKKDWFDTITRKIAFEDFLAREAATTINNHDKNFRGTGKSGLIYVDCPGQEVLPRTTVKVDDNNIEFRLSVGLPAIGRRILGKKAAQMLCQDIPIMMKKTICNYDMDKLISHLSLADEQEAIRNYINKNNYVSFIANGAILPRKSGVSNLPLLSTDAVPFQSPSSLEIKIPLPTGKLIKGMAIPEGISLIVGGGFHGKSTLLKAIERGVYNHIKGDGREYVITNNTAMKIRAEEGRRVEKVNISPFISNLPLKKDTYRFSTEDASGSTSQAANIIEALEMGSQVILIDEDTSATNFMIRDARMQELVNKGKEPITPFIDKVRSLYNDYRISTVLVLGGSGDYFDVANNIIMMDEYKTFDVTQKAKDLCKKITISRKSEGGQNFGDITYRIIKGESFNAWRGKKEKFDTKGLHTIIYGKNIIDLAFVEQIIDPSQTRAIANMIKLISDKYIDNSTTLPKLLDKLYTTIEQNGLEYISPYYGKHPGDLALPRKLELACAINRLRTTQVK